MAVFTAGGAPAADLSRPSTDWNCVLSCVTAAGRLVGGLVQAMQRERGVVQRPAIGVAHRDGDVADDLHRLGRDLLVADDQRDAVVTRHHERTVVAAAATAATTTAAACRRRAADGSG